MRERRRSSQARTSSARRPRPAGRTNGPPAAQLVRHLGRHGGNRAAAEFVQRRQLDPSPTTATTTTNREPVARQTEPPVDRRRGSQRFGRAFAFTFDGQLGRYSDHSLRPDPGPALRDWIRDNVDSYPTNTGPSQMAARVTAELGQIAREVTFIPGRRYRFRIDFTVSARYSVDVSLNDLEKHRKAGAAALAAQAEKERVAAKKTADDQAAATAKKDAEIDARFDDKKFIIREDGGGDLVERSEWEPLREEVVASLAGFRAQYGQAKAELQKASDEVGLIGRIGAAYSGRGVRGYRKPNPAFYWKATDEYLAKASAHLAMDSLNLGKDHIADAQQSLALGMAMVKHAQQEWNSWVQDSARGAATAVSVLEVTEFAGVIAVTALTGGAAAAAEAGAIVTIGGGAVIGAANEMVKETGAQLVGGDEFDFDKLFRSGAGEIVSGLVGGILGGALQKTFLKLCPNYIKQFDDETVDFLVSRLQQTTEGAAILSGSTQEALRASFRQSLLNAFEKHGTTFVSSMAAAPLGEAAKVAVGTLQQDGQLPSGEVVLKAINKEFWAKEATKNAIVQFLVSHM